MTHLLRHVCVALGLALAGPASAQFVNETLAGTSASFDWMPLDGACLTAGTGGGTIPPCVGLGYYTDRTSVLSGGTQGRLGAAAGAAVPDPSGQGALRLTNGEIGPGATQSGLQRGAVVSKFTFPTLKGVQVVFSTVTYGGNNLNGSGADGMSFFLMDGRYSPAIGGTGGNLGYRCNAVNGEDGVSGGYLGIGIDEYGNYAGVVNAVSVLGAGNITWSALNKAWPAWYPAWLTFSQRAAAVARTCNTGYFWDHKLNPGKPAPTGLAVPYAYRQIGSSVTLPAGLVLANQQGATLPLRRSATALKFKLVISQDGLINLNFRANGGAPTPLLRAVDARSTNGPVPETLRFGFAGSTGAGTNIHEITCFRAETPRQSAGSGASDTGTSGRVFAGSQMFIGSYDEMSWSGDLRALALNIGTDGYVQPAALPTWSASCTLTGGACPALGSASSSVTGTPRSGRNLITWSGSSGIPLDWASLPGALRSALDGPTGTGAARLAYLTGDRSGELSASGGTYRIRDSILGDIIHSSPRWVGPPGAAYPDVWTDLLQPGAKASETAYSAFRTSQAGRTSVVYVGANDGLVHGFRAGTGRYDGDGNFQLVDATTNDGRELLGFAPWRALQTLHSASAPLDFSSPQYAHNLFVDAPPGSGDLFYGGAWHTWLVGGLGFGGNPGGVFNSESGVGAGSLYVLDITDPSRFSASNAASLVVDNLDATTLACTASPSCAGAFGSQVGTPAIVRLHNGQWAIVFGNGLNSEAGTAGLFIALVNPRTGKLQLRFLDTGAGPSTVGTTVVARNGIAEVMPVDLDGDKVTDFVYAGDAFGNLWRFDLTAASPAAWSVSKLAAVGLPITTQVAVDRLPGSPARLMVAFGTGRSWPQTMSADVGYAATGQKLYGLWDWNFSAWNAKVPPAAQFQSLAAPPASGTLRTQTLSTASDGTAASFGLRYQTLTRFTVCWWGTSSCTGANTDVGWSLSLNDAQVIYNPLAYGGLVLVNSIVPPNTNPLSCDFLYPTGFTLAVDMASGGGAAVSPFGDGSAAVDAIGLDAVGTPLVVRTGDKLTLVTPDVTGAGRSTPLNLFRHVATGGGRRLNWLKVR